MSGRRLPALVVLVALLAGLVALGRNGTGTEPVSFGRSRAERAPVADGPAALSSTWYCAAGTAAFAGPYNLTVVVTNAGDVERRGSITWMPSTGEPVTTTLRLGPRVTLAVAAAANVLAPGVSALVEVDGGGVGVEHTVSGARGTGVAPCASQPSARWYFANGVTERDADQDLYLFNPFPDDAVVDLGFSTSEGRDEPRALEGLPVAAGSTKVVHLQDFVRRRSVTATAVVARTGRLVVDRVQSFDGSAGRSGLSLALGAPATATAWSFPDGFVETGVGQRWHVYNPTDREAEASLEVVPAEGEALPPYDFIVPARTEVVLDPAAIDGLAPGIAHSSTVRSLNGVGVVVERAVDARRPAPRRGWSSALGSPLEARRWLFPVGEANGRTDEWIVVQNPGARRVEVSLRALVAGRVVEVEGAQDLAVPAGGRRAVRLGDHIQRTPLPLLVTATGPIVAERDTYGVFRVGVATIMGIPLP